MKETFIVMDDGDSTVGIPPTDSVITVDDNVECDVNDFKVMLSDYYDTKKVYTKTEYELIMKNEWRM